MAQQNDDTPPIAPERVTAVGEALGAAYPPVADAIPEPMVRLMLELSREKLRPHKIDPVVVAKPNDAGAVRVARWLVTLIRRRHKG